MKKFISMAMALVMTLSLCVFVSPTKAAAGFEDASELSSQYAVQAADVIQKIEVMDGYEDGTFRPTAGLTRQAAAKIICNMILGPTTAKALPTNANPFPDVLAGNQFAGYISYCEQQGIISGYADGTFRGGDPLSGYAYLKMLLGALGYDARHEGFVGDNWKVNVAKIALGIGLNQGIQEDLDGATQVTRESAAIYAFNTLQADMVEYDSKNTLEINGVTVSMGGGNAIPQTWNTSATQANHISAADDNGRPIVQFAERYFDKLEREPNGAGAGVGGANTNGRDEYVGDDFGRPSVRWKWKGVEIGTYSRDPDVRFVGNVKVNAIYEALGMTSGDDHAHLYINSSVANNEDLQVKRANDKDLDHANNLKMYRDGDADLGAHDIGESRSLYGDGAHRVDRIGDGCLIECFHNEANNHVDVCVISVYGGKIDAVKAATAKKDAYVTVSYGSDAARRPDTIATPGKNEYETEDFDEEDYVAYTYSDSAQGIKNMYLMDVESGVLESRVSGKNLKLDGVAYPYGKEYAFSDMKESDLSGKSSYVVYLFSWSANAGFDDVDDDQYVLLVEEDEFAVDQYVLIERISIENKNGVLVPSTLGGTAPNDVQARVRTSSGGVKTVSLDDSKNYRTEDGLNIANAFAAGRIVRLSNNSNGYRLHALDDKYYCKVDNFTIEGKDIAGTAVNGKATSGGVIKTPEGETLLVDSETYFTVEDTANDTYKAYVGTKNVPDVKGGSTAYVYHRGPLAKQIFITEGKSVSSSTKDVVFLLAPSTSNLVESDDGDYFDVTAVDKDEVVTLRIKAGASFESGRSYFQPGSGIANTKNEGNCVVLNKLTYDSNDLVTAGEFDQTKVKTQWAIGIRRVNSEEVRFDTNTARTSYLRDVAENVRVFFADGSDIEQIDYSEIVNDTQDAVYYVYDDDVVTYIFIVNYEDDGIPASATAPAPAVASATVVSAAVGYTLTISATNVSVGDSFTYTIVDDTNPGVNLTKADLDGVGLNAWVHYVDTANQSQSFVATESGGIWTVNVPDLLDGSTITLDVAV